jgi:hypothetical protein
MTAFAVILGSHRIFLNTKNAPANAAIESSLNDPLLIVVILGRAVLAA